MRNIPPLLKRSNHVCSDHKVSDGRWGGKGTLCHVDERWDTLKCNETFLPSAPVTSVQQLSVALPPSSGDFGKCTELSSQKPRHRPKAQVLKKGLQVWMSGDTVFVRFARFRV